MIIEIIEQYTTGPLGDSHCVRALIDGIEILWDCGDSWPDDIYLALEDNYEMLLSDYYRRQYRGAVVNPQEGETELEAWERIEAQEKDDRGVLLSECKGFF